MKRLSASLLALAIGIPMFVQGVMAGEIRVYNEHVPDKVAFIQQIVQENGNTFEDRIELMSIKNGSVANLKDALKENNSPIADSVLGPEDSQNPDQLPSN